MPEGDTVHRTAERLDAALRDRVVERAELRWPSVPDVELRGSRTVEVVARGKHILHRFDTGATLHTHLRMEGQWRVAHPGPETERALRRHDLRAAVLTSASSAVGLRLGMLDLVPTSREADLVGHLGPDVLGPDWDLERAAANVAAYRGSIGDALLDQGVLAGVGTFWASELLFLERILPWTPTDRVGDEALVRVLRRLHRLMDAARRKTADRPSRWTSSVVSSSASSLSSMVIWTRLSRRPPPSSPPPLASASGSPPRSVSSPAPRGRSRGR